MPSVLQRRDLRGRRVGGPVAPPNAAPRHSAVCHAASAAARVENGLTKDELVEAITHLAFYAGWPNAMSAISRLKDIVENPAEAQADSAK
ncbi:carboxymuconolactone decarboxylase family protein [Streptomyces sp. NPDC059373]